MSAPEYFDEDVSEGELSDDSMALKKLIDEHGYVEGWRRHAGLEGLQDAAVRELTADLVALQQAVAGAGGAAESA